MPSSEGPKIMIKINFENISENLYWYGITFNAEYNGDLNKFKEKVDKYIDQRLNFDKRKMENEGWSGILLEKRIINNWPTLCCHYSNATNPDGYRYIVPSYILIITPKATIELYATLPLDELCKIAETIKWKI